MLSTCQIDGQSVLAWSMKGWIVLISNIATYTRLIFPTFDTKNELTVFETITHDKSRRILFVTWTKIECNFFIDIVWEYLTFNFCSIDGEKNGGQLSPNNSNMNVVFIFSW